MALKINVEGDVACLGQELKGWVHENFNNQRKVGVSLGTTVLIAFGPLGMLEGIPGHNCIYLVAHKC